jgi:hypothetical protein
VTRACARRPVTQSSWSASSSIGVGPPAASNAAAAIVVGGAPVDQADFKALKDVIEGMK